MNIYRQNRHFSYTTISCGARSGSPQLLIKDKTPKDCLTGHSYTYKTEKHMYLQRLAAVAKETDIQFDTYI